jgi:hypothetical protein
MRLRYIRKSAASTLLLILTVAMVVPLSVSALQAGGNGTVAVQVCPQSGEASMTLDAPLGGTIVESRSVVVKGQAAKLSDMEFYVNDSHQKTLVLGSSAVGYEQTLALVHGSNRLKVIGYDACHRVVQERSVTLTVAGPAAETAGNSPAPVISTPRKISAASTAAEEAEAAAEAGKPADSAAAGGRQENATVGADGKPEARDEDTILDSVIGGLDLQTIFRDGGTVARSALNVVAVTLVVIPQVIVGLGQVSAPFMHAVGINLPAGTNGPYTRMRLLGVLLLFGAFIV